MSGSAVALQSRAWSAGSSSGVARRARLDARRATPRRWACSRVSGPGRSPEGRHALGRARRLRARRGGRHRASGREPARARLPAGAAGDRRSLRRLDRPTDAIVEEIASREPRVRLLPARARGRSPRSTARSGRRRARSSRSPTRTRSGSRTRCASWRGTSPTRRWGTSAASFASRRPTARTSRASTGATRSGCASRSRRAARSRPATGRSTP